MTNQNYLRFDEDITALMRRTEYLLDEELNTLYNYVSRKSENISYDLQINVDPYEVKDILNQSFSLINTDFLENFKYCINLVRRSLRDGMVEENSAHCKRFIDNIYTLTEIDLPRLINVGLGRFEEAFNYTYKTNYNENTCQLGRILLNTINDEISNLRGVLKKNIQDNAFEITNNFLNNQEKQVNNENISSDTDEDYFLYNILGLNRDEKEEIEYFTEVYSMLKQNGFEIVNNNGNTLIIDSDNRCINIDRNKAMIGHENLSKTCFLFFNPISNSENGKNQIRVAYNLEEADICIVDGFLNDTAFSLESMSYYGPGAYENENKNTPDFTIESEDNLEVETDKLLNNEWIKQNLIIKKLEEQSEMKM